MGLGLEVGLLADVRESDREGYEERLQQFVVVNQALRAAGLPEHHEPEDLEGREPWWCAIGHYNTLHGLRRLAAHLWARGQLPEPDLPASLSDQVTDACHSGAVDAGNFWATPHLLLHSDCGGFYLPMPFGHVVEPDPQLFETAGGWIGSSQMLLKECYALADVLELPLDDGLIWEGQADWWGDEPKGPDTPEVLWERYFEEARVCKLLHNACLVSIRTGCAICFV